LFLKNTIDIAVIAMPRKQKIRGSNPRCSLQGLICTINVLSLRKK
jgi:hypothetical protein